MRGVASGRWPPAIAALAGLALTGAAALGVAPRWDAASMQRELDALGESRRQVLQLALSDLAGLLEAMAGHLSRLERPVRPSDFEAFSADAAQEFAGAVELGWMAPIGAPRALARADVGGEPRFALVFVAGRLPGTPAGAGAGAEERAALELAAERGRLAATPTRESGGETVVAFAPVPAAAPAAAAPGSPRMLAGLVRCRVDVGEVVDHVLRELRVPRGLDVHLFRDGASAGDLPLHVRSSLLRAGSPAPRPLAVLEAGPHVRTAVSFADARWTVLVVPMPGGPLATEHGRARGIAAWGLLLTAALVAYVATVGAQERRLARAAAASRVDAAAARYRGELLHAIADAAKELAAMASVDAAMERALKAVGQAALVDRVTVLERLAGLPGAPASVATRHVWRSALAPRNLAGTAGAPAPDGPAAQLLALAGGRPYAAVVSAMPEPLRAHWAALGVRSILLVPMAVEGAPWGALTLEDCTADRDWTSAEIDILKTLSDLAATSIARARHEKALADANTIVENSTTVLYRLRCERGFPMSYVSRNVAALGHDAAALLRAPRSYVALIHPEDVARVSAGFERLAVDGTRPEPREVRLRTWGDGWRWFESRHAPVRDAAGRIVEIEGVLVDVTERKQAEERIATMARTDALTGAANRATFLERLELAFALAARNHRPFAVHYLDVDRFKEVNDTHGHAVGDELITSVARRLGECTRKTDLVARLGGDEFAVLQAEVADADGAGALARKICEAVSEPHELAGRQLRVTVSVGVAQWSREVERAGDLLAQADRALYLAKQEGRDRFRFHSEELDAQVRLHAALGEELRGAIGRDELELHYQPQVELASGAILGMEALVRWRHPARGLLGPGDFLPVAERTGAILPLSRWVLERACRQLALWRRDGIAPPTLAVNLSLAQVRTGDELVEAVTATLARHGLPPEALEFDVTEAMLAHAVASSSDVLERLRDLGVRIAVDDFGTQSSSLEHLRAYRVSRLTIPRAMVEGAQHDPGQAASVRAIVAIARELGLAVIAQGIETERQRDFLAQAASSARGQGFFFSRPVPAAQATELLRGAGRGSAPPESALVTAE